MYSVDIPGFGEVRVEVLVSDFTGTLSVDGALLPGVADRLNRISEFMQVQILTADTFGKAREALEKVNCTITILTGVDHDLQKEAQVKDLGPEKVAALGNGNNDRRMLAAARVGIAVAEGEGLRGGGDRGGEHPGSQRGGRPGPALESQTAEGHPSFLEKRKGLRKQ